MFPAKVILLSRPLPPRRSISQLLCTVFCPSACRSYSTLSHFAFPCILPKPRSAATHYFTLADQLGTELGAVQCQVDVKVHTVECALRCVHALKVLLKVLAGEIGCQGDDFLNTCIAYTVSLLSCAFSHLGNATRENLRGSLVYSGQTSSSHANRISSYISVAPGATCRKNDTLTGSPILTF